MNYTELKTALASWLDNTEVSDIDIDTFIRIAEAKMNRTLRVMNQIEEYTFTAVDGGEYYDLPSDFIGARQISINGRDLDYLTPEQFDGVMFRNVTFGSSRYYTIINNKLRLKPSTASTDNIVMWYYKKIPPLKDNNTNWVGDQFEDAYIYGALEQANMFLYDDAKSAQYSQLFTSVLNQIDAADKADRWSGGTMTARIIF